MLAAASWSSVDLPAPFGPRIAQRSSSSTDQSIWSRSVFVPRRTLTSTNCSTASGLSSATYLSNRTCRLGDGSATARPRRTPAREAAGARRSDLASSVGRPSDQRDRDLVTGAGRVEVGDRHLVP